MTPFELHHGRKLRTELTNIIKGKPYLANWVKLSAENRPKIPIYISRDAERTVTNHFLMAEPKAQEKLLMNQKSQRKKHAGEDTIDDSIRQRHLNEMAYTTRTRREIPKMERTAKRLRERKIEEFECHDI